MRRQIGKFLPIVAIAVLVQLFAPIAASWAMTSAMSAALDPLSSVPICSSLHLDEGGNQQPSGHQPDHQNCCPLCSVAQSNALADDPDTAIAIPQRYASLIAWSDNAFDLAFTRYDSVAQARAPPQHS